MKHPNTSSNLQSLTLLLLALVALPLTLSGCKESKSGSQPSGTAAAASLKYGTASSAKNAAQPAAVPGAPAVPGTPTASVTPAGAAAAPSASFGQQTSAGHKVKPGKGAKTPKAPPPVDAARFAASVLGPRLLGLLRERA